MATEEMLDEQFYGFGFFSPGLEFLEKLSDEKVAALTESVKSERAFDPSKERVENLARELNAEGSSFELQLMLRYLAWLYTSVQELVRQGSPLKEAVVQSMRFSLGPKRTAAIEESLLISRLVDLVEKNPSHERLEKLKTLRTGLLDTANSFSAFVDLRARLDEDRTKIFEYVPVAIVRIGVEREARDDSAFVFQLTQDGVAKLRALVEDIEKKLKCLKEDPKIGSDIVFSADVEAR